MPELKKEYVESTNYILLLHVRYNTVFYNPAMACRLCGAKPLPVPMISPNFTELWTKHEDSHSRKYIWKHRLQNTNHFVSASMY